MYGDSANPLHPGTITLFHCMQFQIVYNSKVRFHLGFHKSVFIQLYFSDGRSLHRYI